MARPTLAASLQAQLPIALLALLLLAPVPGALASEPMPPPGDVWRVHTAVDALVHDNYATVEVVATITNDGPDPEFPFEVRVPDEALVTGLTIERDGVVHHGEVKERDQARDQYDQAKREERTAGLVEKHRHSSVYAYLVNVEGFERVVTTLTYEVPLEAHRGVYELPLEAPVGGFGRDTGATLSATVTHTDGVASAWATPEGQAVREDDGFTVHRSVGPRSDENGTPMTLHYALPATGEAGSLVATVDDGTGYFAHRLRAQANATQLPLDLALVLDTSGSMSGEKIAQLQDAATQMMAHLDDEDRLHLTLFSSSARSPWSGLRPATIDTVDTAVEEVRRSYAAGGTNIAEAIGQGFAPFEGYNGTDRLPLVIFLTDGRGGTPPDQLRQMAHQANQNGAYVFALAFGASADWELVHGLAQDGNGTALWVPAGQGAEVDLRSFMEALTTPVLRDVAVDYGPGVDPLVTGAPVLFAGSELLVVGTFDPEERTHLKATLNARGPDGDRTYEVEAPLAGASEAPWLPRLVAHYQVNDLQDRLEAYGPNHTLSDQVIELGLAHGFVTDHTSLVLDLDHNGPTMVADDQADGGDDRASRNRTSASGAPAATADTAQEARTGGGGGTGPVNGDQRSPPATSHGPHAADTDDQDASEWGGEDGTPQATPVPGLAVVLVVLVGLGLAARPGRIE